MRFTLSNSAPPYKRHNFFLRVSILKFLPFLIANLSKLLLLKIGGWLFFRIIENSNSGDSNQSQLFSIVSFLRTEKKKIRLWKVWKGINNFFLRYLHPILRADRQLMVIGHGFIAKYFLGFPFFFLVLVPKAYEQNSTRKVSIC